MWAKFVQFIRSSIFKKELEKGNFKVKNASVAGQLDGEICLVHSSILSGEEGLYCIFIALPEESFTIPIYWRGYGSETHYHNGYRGDIDYNGVIGVYYDDNEPVGDRSVFIFKLTTKADIA